MSNAEFDKQFSVIVCHHAIQLIQLQYFNAFDPFNATQLFQRLNLLIYSTF